MRKFFIIPSSINQSLWRFFKYLRPYWKKALVALLFMLFSVGMQIPIPFFTKYLVDKVVLQRSFSILNIIGFALVAIVLINQVSQFIQNFTYTTFRGRVMYDIRKALFSHIQRVPISVFAKQHTGYLMSRISDDVESVQGLLANTIVSALQNIIIFCAGLVCSFWIHPKLTLVCCSILPFYLLSLVIFNDRIMRRSRDYYEKMANMKGELQELLSGITVIKAFTAEGRSCIQWMMKVKETIKASIQLDIIIALAGMSSSLISTAGPIVLIWYGCSEIMRGNLTIGGLIAFNSFIGYLFGPVRSLYDLNVGIQRSLAAVERIFEILDTKKEIDNGRPISIKSGRIIFDNVLFAYHRGTPVLNGLSFIIEPGKSVALVGRSGAGKTTAIMMLLRFYRPDQGRILIDGQDINDISSRSLRQQIGLVSQDTFLFSGTIRDNIGFGQEGADESEIEKAARMAHAHDFIIKLKDGYDTMVGERGCALSGGQRQRITLARAFLKDPPILILDEATSQIDNESEQLIRSAMEAFRKTRTSIIIAHRLNTIQNADSIYVLDEGRINDFGTHDTLLTRNGLYQYLYKTSFQYEGKSEIFNVLQNA